MDFPVRAVLVSRTGFSRRQEPSDIWTAQPRSGVRQRRDMIQRIGNRCQLAQRIVSELRYACRHQPHQTLANREAQFVQLRKTLPTFGARRLIREFELPISHRALERIWREHGLLHKRRRKYQRKQDLAHIKAQWALFQQISADTKDLDDIPRYGRQAQSMRLPLNQYTARKFAAACCSGLSPRNGARRPAPCSL